MGSLDGVVTTRSAWIGSREVVEVKFHPDVLPFEDLLDHAIRFSCDQRVYTTTKAQMVVAKRKVGDRVEEFDGELRDAKASDQLYYLGRSHLRYLPLTPAQARKVNAALGRKSTASPEDFLSPRQTELARKIHAKLKADGKAFEGLERPDELSRLADYRTRLVARL